MTNCTIRRKPKVRILHGGAVYLNGVLYIPTTSVEQYKVIDYDGHGMESEPRQ